MWSEVWNLHCLIFPWWLERMFNRTKLPNLNFKGILSSVFFLEISLCSFSAFLWPENAISGQRSFSLLWYDALNLQCLFFPRWLVQTGSLGVSTFKLDVIFVACIWDTRNIFEFQEIDLFDECIVINFQHFVDLKMRFLDNDLLHK
jgi:hypothetical protein